MEKLIKLVEHSMKNGNFHSLDFISCSIICQKPMHNVCACVGLGLVRVSELRARVRV